MKVIHADQTSLTVSWKPPLREGKSPVTRYIVEKRTPWTQVAVVPADEISCVADNLNEGTEYGFRITAVNKYGKSPFLESDQTYTPKSSYKSPQTTTGSPETAETDTSDIKESPQTTTGSPETTETDISDIKAPPSKPRTMKVTHADRTSLTVSWKPPLREGKSLVTSYIVEKGTPWTQVAEVPADEISCVADNLIKGTEYGFRITAVNKYGKSPFLESDQTYTPKSSYKSPPATTGSPYKAETDHQ